MFMGIFDMVEDLFYFGVGEVWVYYQVCGFVDIFFYFVMFELFVDFCGMVVLLDDSVVDGFIGFLFLYYYGFMLIGDVDGCDLIGVDICFGQCFDQC